MKNQIFILFLAWLAILLSACEEKNTAKPRTKPHLRPETGVQKYQKPPLRVSTKAITEHLATGVTETPKLRTLVEINASEMQMTPSKLVASILEAETNDSSLRAAIGMLAGAFPEVEFWGDVAVNLPKCKARSRILSWIQNIKNEADYFQIEKVYSKIEPGSDRTALARALVVYFPGSLADSIKVVETMDAPDEKYAGLKFLAERVGHARFVDPDSISSETIDRILHESASFDTRRRHEIDRLMMPQKGYTLNELQGRKNTIKK